MDCPRLPRYCNHRQGDYPLRCPMCRTVELEKRVSRLETQLRELVVYTRGLVMEAMPSASGPLAATPESEPAPTYCTDPEL